ncbi:3'-5' exonuclease [Sanguibacter sp. HDW7]|uniref:3'-5' exonuclease n=1 Tax=Sanguibacter sp. HDW7 TaxID=2714931 RepID=UPI00140A6F49|nr:3'-5' exonuclease [Sanguibacter sp. HDW7]QIK82242.1 3'-5' exonuclease [Sanguibacter sp. HDW7]
MPYAVIDTETTGFSPAKGDRMLEIAVVRLDDAGDVLDTWETLLDPGRGVGATHVHGITAADVVGAPDFGEVAAHVTGLLAGHVVVGHNIDFDLRFLTAELAAVNEPFTLGGKLCTQRLAPDYLPGPKRTLAVCCEQAGIVNDHAHSALGDTLATAELFAFYLRHHRGTPPWASVVAQASRALPADDLFAALTTPPAPRTHTRTLTR